LNTIVKRKKARIRGHENRKIMKDRKTNKW